MVRDRRAFRNLLFAAKVFTIVTIAFGVYALTWSPLFGPERTLFNRVAGPALGGVFLVVGWIWLLRIARAR